MTGSGRSTAVARMLLADGRFPSGAPAHSGGVEAAVEAGLVRDLADLEAWVVGCLHRQWLVEAAAAVQAVGLVEGGALVEGNADIEEWTALDTELVACTTAPLQAPCDPRPGTPTVARRAGGVATPGAGNNRPCSR